MVEQPININLKQELLENLMALTESTSIETGTLAPNFRLLDTLDNKFKTLNDLKGNVATVIMFICNHCPFVMHINTQLVRLANDYHSKGISFIAISSNDAATHPADGPEQMRFNALELGYPFPYLYDETQEVAKAYQAACTPEFYIYERNLKMVYHGQLDDSRPSLPIPSSGYDIRQQLNSLIDATPYNAEQKLSIGCNIKWKAQY